MNKNEEIEKQFEQYKDLKKVPLIYKNDIDVVKKFLIDNGWNIRYILEQFKNNEEIARIAMKTYDSVLKYMSKEIQSNKELIAIEIEKNHDSFVHINDTLKNDKEYILELLKINKKIFKYLNEDLRSDIDIVKEAFKKKDGAYINRGIDILSIGKNLMNNREEVEKLILLSGKFFEGAVNFHNDIELIGKAVKNGFTEIKLLTPKIVETKMFARIFLKKNPDLYYKIEMFYNSKDLVKIVFEKRPDLSGSIYRRLDNNVKEDLEIAAMVLDRNSQIIVDMPVSIKEDIDFLMPYIKRDSLVLMLLPLEIKIKPENLYKLKQFYLAEPECFPKEIQYLNNLQRAEDLEKLLDTNSGEKEKIHTKKKI